ncbi:MAG: Mur ligase domain-containing protein, partial [Deltaproteobacteria bacterium]|nr:Mur ligase domain-containing protein [Deltaproteobacteria bacterium]
MAVNCLNPELNELPSDFILGSGKHVHLIGVGGIAMAALAGLISETGCLVTGSDLEIYPPASDYLESIGLKPLFGYGPETLSGTPDFVVVGNVVTSSFPVLAKLKCLKIPYLSLPQVLEKFFLTESQNVVVVGCHGKTSLANLISLLCDRGGLPSGRFIGGASLDFSVPWKSPPSGGVMVIEGDEYDCAFFDKNPKFLHYRPKVVVLTSVDYDHADIYPNHQSVKEAYLRLMAMMPENGLVIYYGDDPEVTAVAQTAPCALISYGTAPSLDIRVSDFTARGLSVDFTVSGRFRTRTREVGQGPKPKPKRKRKNNEPRLEGAKPGTRKKLAKTEELSDQTSKAGPKKGNISSPSVQNCSQEDKKTLSDSAKPVHETDFSVETVAQDRDQLQGQVQDQAQNQVRDQIREQVQNNVTGQTGLFDDFALKIHLPKPGLYNSLNAAAAVAAFLA